MSQRCQYALFFLALMLLLGSAFQSTQAAEPLRIEDIQEAYLPGGEFERILKGSDEKIAISEHEYQQLLRTLKAREDNSNGSPVTVLGRTDISMQCDGDRIRSTATLHLQANAPGIVELPMVGWNIEQSHWKLLNAQPVETPSILRQSRPDMVEILIPVAGSHELQLKLSAHLNSENSNIKTSQLSLFGGSSGEAQILIPTGKSIRLNDFNLSDFANNERLATLPIGGIMDLHLQIADENQSPGLSEFSSVTSHLQFTVEPAAIQWTCTSTLKWSGTKHDEVYVSIPQHVVLETIQSQNMIGWEFLSSDDEIPTSGTNTTDALKPDAESGPSSRQVIKIRMQQPVNQQEITLQGTLNTTVGQEFQLNAMRWHGMNSQTGFIEVNFASELRLHMINHAGLVAVNADYANRNASPTANHWSFRFWKSDFDLRLVAALKQAGLQCAIRNLLTIEDARMQLESDVIVDAIRAPIFELKIRFPTQYQITQVSSETAITDWTITQADAGVSELLIVLAQPLSPATTAAFKIFAETHPEGWPIWGETTSISIPNFELLETELAEIDFGIIADQEFELAPLETENLYPVNQSSEQASPESLGQKYRLDFSTQSTKYSGRFQIGRVPGILTADSAIILSIEEESTSTQLSSKLKVWGGGIKSLLIDTPDLPEHSVRFHIAPRSGARPTQIVEQLASAATNGRRTWTLNFDRPLIGEYQLDCRVVLPRRTDDVVTPVDFRFPKAISQSGLIAVAGPENQRLQITTQGADGFPLNESDLADIPSQLITEIDRYLAAYQFTQSGWTVSARLERLVPIAVPNAIANRLEMTTSLDIATHYHHAELKFLVASAHGIVVKLPESSELLGVTLNQSPVTPAKTQSGYLISTVGLTADAQQELTVDYSLSNASNATLKDSSSATVAGESERLSQVELHRPNFLALTPTGEFSELPILKQTWNLAVSKADVVISTSGDYQADSPRTVLPWLTRLQAAFTSPTKTFSGIVLPIAIILTIGTVGLRVLLNARKRRKGGLLRYLLIRGGLATLLVFLLSETFLQNIPAIVRQTPKMMPDSFMPDTVFSMSAEQQSHPHSQNSTVHQVGSDGVSESESEAVAIAPPQMPNLPTFENARWYRYEYAGNSVGESGHTLNLKIMPRIWVNSLCVALICLIALVTWWIRQSAIVFRAVWFCVTIAIPLALSSVATGWLAFLLMSLVIGGLLGLAVCGIACLGCTLIRVREALWIRSGMLKATGTLIILCSLAPNLLVADEPVPPAVKVVPAPNVVRFYDVDTLNWNTQSHQVWLDQAFYHQLQKAGLDLSKIKSFQHAFVSEAEFSGSLGLGEKNSASIQFTASWTAFNSTGKPATITLPSPPGVLTNVQVDGADVFLSRDSQGHYQVSIESKDSPQAITAMVSCEALGSFEEGSLNIPADPSINGRFRLNFPAQDAEWSVKIDGVNTAITKDHEANFVSVTLPLAGANAKHLKWKRISNDDSKTAFITVEQKTSLVVNDFGIEQTSEFTLFVQRGGINTVSFSVPNELRLLHVSADVDELAQVTPITNAQETQSTSRTLNLSFSRMITDRVVVKLVTAQPVTFNEAAQDVTVKFLDLIGNGRVQRLIAVSEADGLSIGQYDTSGLSQTSHADHANQLSGFLDGASLTRLYRSTGSDIGLTLKVVRQAESLTVKAFQAVRIRPREMSLASKFEISSPTTSRRQFEILLPEDYQLINVTSDVLQDWAVVNFQSEKRLVVELTPLQSMPVVINLEGKFLRVNGQNSITLNLPAIESNTQSTMLAVWDTPSEQLNIASQSGWETVPSDQLDDRYAILNAAAPKFLFQAQESTSPLTIQLQPILPTIEAASVTTVAVGNSTIDYGFTLKWQVTRSATDTFAITVPEWLGELEFDRASLRQVRSEKAEGNQRRWIVTTLNPIQDQLLLSALATIPLPVDQLVQTPLIYFQLMHGPNPHADLPVQQHFAVWVNLSHSQIDAVDSSKLETVLPSELSVVIPNGLIQQAVKICRIKSHKVPTWRMTRMQSITGSRAVVLQATLNTMLQHDGSWRTQSIYAVRNRGQQFLALRLPEHSSILSASVRGKPTRLLNRELNGELITLLALPQTSVADLSFDVLFTLQGQLPVALPSHWKLASHKFQLPAPKVITPEESEEFGIPTAQCLWNIYLPKDLVAFPDQKGGRSNVEWHGANSASQEMKFRQQRIESDFSELFRVFQDATNSVQQRSRAMQNLYDYEVETLKNGGRDEFREIEKELQAKRNEGLPSLQRGAGGLNGSLMSETQAGVTIEEAQSYFGNQAYILSNNLSIGQLNGIATQSARQRNATDSFSFDRPSASPAIDAAGAEKSDTQPFASGEPSNQATQLKQRSQLREQLDLLEEKSSTQNSQLFRKSESEQSNSLHWPSHPHVDNGAAINIPEGMALQYGIQLPPGASYFSSGILETNIATDSDFQNRSDAASDLNFLGDSPTNTPTQQTTPSAKLSLNHEMDLIGQKLTFSCVGGNPELTLVVRGGWITKHANGLLWSACVMVCALFVLLFWSRSRVPIGKLLLAVGIAVALIPQPATFHFGYFLMTLGFTVIAFVAIVWPSKKRTAA